MATQSQRAKLKSSKSTLLSHTFPPFYACYLLKSIRTPKAVLTYIGSTPHPPRRIRQHNGEISQGAWKTAQNRPWIMNMIVHGFPSKLAALQFEWAWQNPNLSRHLKGRDIMKGRSLRRNIAVVRSMLAMHPYTNWPLHVKLFTPEAVKCWTDAGKKSTPLPPGFTYSVELEGVDGKGNFGNGRTGPIDVTDKVFASEHLAKHAAILATGETHKCTICESELDFHTCEPLSLALCPTSNCTAYSHLTCLATSFLASSSTVSGPSLIPRGGTCNSCHQYILWGDVIRGCYRRRIEKYGAAIDQSAIVEEAERENDDGEKPYEDDLEGLLNRKRKTRADLGKTSSQGKKNKRVAIPSVEEGEYFEFDTTSDSESSPSSPSGRRQLITQKIKLSAPRRGRSPGPKSRLVPALAAPEVPGEVFDIDDFSSTDDNYDTRTPRPKSRSTSHSTLADAFSSLGIHHSDI